MPASGLRWLIKGLFRRGQLEQETDDELRFHIEARADDLMARRNLSRDQAIRESRLEFGGVARYRERVREARAFRQRYSRCWAGSRSWDGCSSRATRTPARTEL